MQPTDSDTARLSRSDLLRVPTLRVPGYVAAALLVVVAVAEGRLVAAANGQRTLIDRALGGQGVVTIDQADQADHTVHVAINVVNLALVAAAAAFVVWFWTMRRVAGIHAPDSHRWGQPWAFWAWVVPVVNLWFPYRMTDDALAVLPSRSPGRQRLVRAWWAAWLLAIVSNRVAAAASSGSVDDLRTKVLLEMGAGLVAIVAAALAVAVVIVVGRAFDAYREALLHSD